MNNRVLFTLSFVALSPACIAQLPSSPSVRVGLDNLQSYSRLFENKQIGLITNHTGVDRRGRPAAKCLAEFPGARIVALFSPEHGFDGKLEAGIKVADQNDPQQSIPIYSLYGETKKPTSAMLKDVEVLVFDIQDVGARFYTYLSTMSVCMEAAAEKGIPFVVLDRPNPLAGRMVEGPLMDKKFASFIGLHPIPVRYGLTVGELARMINDQGWLKDGLKADLTVIPLGNWTRSTWWDQTGLPFIPPSPNIRTLDAAIAFPGICLIEGTNLSEGRGTDIPFLQFGAPWVNALDLSKKLNALKLPGVSFSPTEFKPTSSKCRDQLCQGIRLRITDRDAFQPFWTGVKIVESLYREYPKDFKFLANHFDRLCGTGSVRTAIEQKKDLTELQKRWLPDLDQFRADCRPILLYP
ncbi:MAG: DUF1343 domain-containing protein [Phycisphaerae bacterium]|nr:DUF1343 domain-containing protein [Phycisphaerae bacterium]